MNHKHTVKRILKCFLALSGMTSVLNLLPSGHHPKPQWRNIYFEKRPSVWRKKQLSDHETLFWLCICREKFSPSLYFSHSWITAASGGCWRDCISKAADWTGPDQFRLVWLESELFLGEQGPQCDASCSQYSQSKHRPHGPETAWRPGITVQLHKGILGNQREGQVERKQLISSLSVLITDFWWPSSTQIVHAEPSPLQHSVIFIKL